MSLLPIMIELTVKEVFFGLSFPVAATALALTFCLGAVCNAGMLDRTDYMRKLTGRTGDYHEIEWTAYYR
jgi:hypothetical protein